MLPFAISVTGIPVEVNKFDSSSQSIPAYQLPSSNCTANVTNCKQYIDIVAKEHVHVVRAVG